MDKFQVVLHVEDVPVVMLARALATQGLSIKARADGELHVVRSSANTPLIGNVGPTPLPGFVVMKANRAGLSHNPRACRKCGSETFAVMIPPMHAYEHGDIKLVAAHKCSQCGDVLPDASNSVLPANGSNSPMIGDSICITGYMSIGGSDGWFIESIVDDGRLFRVAHPFGGSTTLRRDQFEVVTGATRITDELHFALSAAESGR